MDYYHEQVETENGIPAKISYGGSGRDQLRYPLHWHRNLEFDLVLEGKIVGSVNGKEQTARAGQIFFVNSGELHETDGSTGGTLRTVTLLLERSLLEEYCRDLDSVYFDIRKNSEEEREIGSLILECGQFCTLRPEYFELELAIRLRKICSVLLHSCRVEANDREKAKWKSNRRIKRALSYLETHSDSRITIEEMGELMGMRPAYFSRYFKKTVGQNFHEYLQQMRANQARNMLESDPEKSVTEIAFACGFANVKSLIETFRKVYGATPGQYRKMLEEKES